MVKKGAKLDRLPKKKSTPAPKKRTAADKKKDTAAAAAYFRPGSTLAAEVGEPLSAAMCVAYAEAVEKAEPVCLTLTVFIPSRGGQVEWELNHQRRPGKAKGKKGKFNPAQAPTGELFDGGKKGKAK